MSLNNMIKWYLHIIVTNQEVGLQVLLKYFDVPGPIRIGN